VPHTPIESHSALHALEEDSAAATTTTIADVRAAHTGPLQCPTEYYTFLQMLCAYIKLVMMLFGSQCEHLAQVLQIYSIFQRRVDMFQLVTQVQVGHLLWGQCSLMHGPISPRITTPWGPPQYPTSPGWCQPCNGGRSQAPWGRPPPHVQGSYRTSRASMPRKPERGARRGLGKRTALHQQQSAHQTCRGHIQCTTLFSHGELQESPRSRGGVQAPA
jgi:hypothetical protein